jgi:hypothetical protein
MCGTPAIFGDYIDVYDIQRAVEDGNTVRIYYEGRLAKIELKEEERPKIDPDFEEVTEEEDTPTKEKLKSKWARMEAMVGTPKRIALIAKDIVDHFEKRLEAMDGKAMIVCMSRRICVELYKEIFKLRTQWHSDDDEKGALKVVMTGSAADILDCQPHIRNKQRRERLPETNLFKVARVLPGGPMDKAGIQSGDVLEAADGYPLGGAGVAGSFWPFTQRLLVESWTPARPLHSEAAWASHSPDQIDEYTFVVVFQIGQVVGEVGEVVAHAGFQVLANMTIDRGQRAAASLIYIR